MKKYKVGYTTGVFDLFHIGHLNILKNAKVYCDYLIAGVSTDELAFEYKHKKPIIPFKERFEIVDSIKYVDKTITQFSLDKIEVWNKYKFDVLFHGDDWKGSALYNETELRLKSAGVDVVYLPHTNGTSSTLLSEILYNKDK